MDTLLGLAVVGVWLTISVVGLKRAYDSHRSSPDSSQQSHHETADAQGSRPPVCC